MALMNKKIHRRVCFMRKYSSPRRGFTLIEVIVAMAVGIIAIGAVYSVYHLQQRVYRNQQLLMEVQQNMRSALYVMEQQIRMAGYDPESAHQFGITDVRRYELIGTSPDSHGHPAIAFRQDKNENGCFDGGGEQMRFCIREDQTSRRTYLAWNMGNGRFPLSETIQAIGMGYAIDDDQDGYPDRWPGTDHLIWAVDSDNDNLLDTNLDANIDGVIDENDDTDGDYRITSADGAPLNKPVSVNRIKAVQIWLMGITRYPLKGRAKARTLVVGDRLFGVDENGLHRSVIQSIIECRNL